MESESSILFSYSLSSSRSFLQIGNMEYKRQINQASAARFRSLATQMSFRLDEGHGVCIYRIGVEDDGCHSLLDYPSVAESARILECIARSLNAVVTERKMIQNEIVREEDGAVVRVSGEAAEPISVLEAPLLGDALGKAVKLVQEPETAKRLRKQPGILTRAELSIQRVETHLLDPSPKSMAELEHATANGNYNDPAATGLSADTEKSSSNGHKSETMSVHETLSSRNIRLAVVGNVDAGKSTLIGTLTTSSLDDGRGKSRTAIMKHRHEIESGRTSTATTHLMGFKSDGLPIAGRDSVRANKRKSEDEVARESYRVITLMDLAGHEKYLKTT